MSKELNDKQRKAIQGVAAGMTYREAGIKAGYTKGAAKTTVAKILTYPYAQDHLKSIREKSESSSILTIKQRKELLTGIAEDNKGNDPNAARQAVAELNKMDGGYEPEKHEVEFIINIGGDAE